MRLAGASGSENVTTTSDPTGTPEAPGAGERSVTVGAVTSPDPPPERADSGGPEPLGTRPASVLSRSRSTRMPTSRM